MRLNHVYHKPCGELEEIPDSSIDAVVTSPPYNLAYKKQPGKKHNMSGYDSFSDSLPQDEYEAGQIRILNACARVLKPGGSIYYVHKERTVNGVAITPHRWVLKTEPELVETIIWDRGSTHQVDPVRLYVTHEYILHLRKPGCPPRFNRKCAKWGKVWRIGFSESRRNAHPAPFPRELVSKCLEMCDLPKGSIILDPYMGAGTTAVVAVNRDMKFIGYEISKKYIEWTWNWLELPLTEQSMRREGERRAQRDLQTEGDEGLGERVTGETI